MKCKVQRKQLTPEEKKGVKAIQYLQKLAGIDESEKKALAGWRAMSENERKFTLDFYALAKEA